MSGMEIDGGSIVIDVKANLAQFDREMDRARREAASAESGRGSWAGWRQRQQTMVRDQIADLRRLTIAEREATREVARREQAMVSASRIALVGRASAAALVGHIAGRNIAELGASAPGSWSARAGGFLSNLTSGNVVGAIKAAGQVAGLTADQIQKIGESSQYTGGKLDTLTAVLREIGQSKAADEIRKVRGELQALQAVDFAARAENVLWTAQGAVTVPRGTIPNDRGGMQGPGGVAAGNFNRADPTAGFEPKGTLNAWLRQRLAIAATTPGKQDDIAETRKAIAYLQRLTKDTRIVGDARTNLYLELKQQQDSLAALTATTPKVAEEPPILPASLELGIEKAKLTQRTSDDLVALRKAEKYLEERIRVEKDINRKVEQTKRLGQIREQIAGLNQTTSVSSTTAAAVLGPLFGGDWLTGDRMQFAQSFGYKPRAGDFLKDVRAENAQASRFLKDIGAIRRKGGSEALVSELAALGPSASGQIHALAGQSPAFISAYSNAVDRRQQLAAQTVRLQEMTVTAGQVTIRTGAVSGPSAGHGPSATSSVDRFQITRGGIGGV